MYNKRRPVGRRWSHKKRTKPSFTPVIVILCLAVGCGYATAKYVVEPVVNYDLPFMAQQEKEKTKESKKTEVQTSEKSRGEVNEKNSIIEDDVKVQDTGTVIGYALQFGCYSGKASAEKVKDTLSVTGLRVLEQNKMYKIVGETYSTKDEARAALEELPDNVNAFVTAIYK